MEEARCSVVSFTLATYFIWLSDTGVVGLLDSPFVYLFSPIYFEIDLGH